MITQRQRGEEDQNSDSPVGRTETLLVLEDVEEGGSSSKNSRTTISFMSRSTRAIVLFDGVCVMCNGFVNFIIDRDTRETIRFASQQSAVGRKVLSEVGLNVSHAPPDLVAPQREIKEGLEAKNEAKNEGESESGSEEPEDPFLPLDTMVLIEDQNRVSTHSTAVIRTIALLGGLWTLFLLLLLIPSCIRDRVYGFVASRRYGWFGRQKQSACRRLNAAVKWRFLDLSSD